MTERLTVSEFGARLAALPGGRHLIGIAGAPASGKSTLAEAIVDRLNADRPGRAAVVPMDGFHYDDLILDARGDRPRKGAPHTFDVDGFRHLLMRLRDPDAPDIAIPVFDREIEIARAGAAILPASVEIVVVEGNYLLLDVPPWDRLAGAFDLTAMVEVSEETLRQRLAHRWESLGLPADEVHAKCEENDLPNGRTVRNRSRAADIVIDPG